MLATKWRSRGIMAVWLLLFTFGLSSLYALLANGTDYVNSSYFQHEQFEGELDRYLNLLSQLELGYVPKEEALKTITVSAEEIEEHRYRYGDLSQQIQDINGQYEGRIQEAISLNNQEAVKFYTAERDTKVQDITKNFTDDEHVRQKIVKEKEAAIEKYYNELEKSRSQFESLSSVFSYYLQNTETKQVYTNVAASDEEDAKKQFSEKDALFFTTFSKDYPFGERDYYMEKAEGGIYDKPIQTVGTFTGVVAIPKSVASSSNELLYRAKQYEGDRKAFWVYVITGLVLFVGSIVMYKKVNLRQRVEGHEWGAYYKSIPIDLQGAFVFLTSLISFVLIANNVMIHPDFVSIDRAFFFLLITSLFVGIGAVQGIWLLQEMKSGKLVWRGALTYKLYDLIKQSFLVRSVGTQLLILLAFVFLLGTGLSALFVKPVLMILYAPFFLVIGIPVLFITLKYTAYLNRILLGTREIVSGKWEKELPVTGKGVLAQLATDINSLKSNVNVSQREQAKSERLKTELITNVSHDLRTPLTSIINYTNLLKTPDLQAEDRKAYIEIIDRKSKRLKVLIDDLFEASKMASGNVELVTERVDLVQLLQQTLAEHDEAIGQSTLQFRVVNKESQLYAVVDGQKIWRVFDNLIGNILKYSLEHTRVYIMTEATKNKAVITFKNISKHELGGNTDELFERFKRGDTSRNTDGSGLGLAIAKSIVDLHDGSLEIEADGDLFKVTVALEREE